MRFVAWPFRYRTRADFTTRLGKYYVDTQPKTTRAEAGRRGGRSTVARHGNEHMAAIGRRGAETFWRRYTVRPVGTRGWVIVERKTERIVAHTDAPDWMNR